MNGLDIQRLNAVGAGKLPGLIGLEIIDAAPERVAGRLEVRDALLAPNGFLHAASVIALVDSLAGYGAMLNLPEGAEGFTTVELKSNFLGTAREGALIAEAKPVHCGRKTQVFDATAWKERDEKTIALFRCTQMVLYPS